jgi:hypothetical protein
MPKKPAVVDEGPDIEDEVDTRNYRTPAGIALVVAACVQRHGGELTGLGCSVVGSSSEQGVRSRFQVGALLGLGEPGEEPLLGRCG